MAPTHDDLSALARQALARLTSEGQATVWWERRLAVGEHGISDLVQQTAELVVLRDGRVGAASTTDLSDAGLDRAAAAAAAHAELDREPVDARCLPEPSRSRAHDGWDPAVLALDPAVVAGELAAAAGGLFVPAFLTTEHGWLLDGARPIEAGERTWAVNGVAEVDPIAVLAATEALTAGQRLVPTDDDSALTIGATLAPALRARGGVTIVG